MKDKSLRGVSILAVLFVAIYNIKYTSKASSSVLTLATEYNSGTVLKEKDAQIHSLQEVITEYQSSMTALKEEFQSSMTALKEELVELKKEKVPVKDAPTLENQTGQDDSFTVTSMSLANQNANHDTLVNTNSTIPSFPTDNKTFRCAFCFFGLPRSYSTLVLPSIEKNILRPNAKYSCDLFVHYFYQTKEIAGRYNDGGNIDPNDVLLLQSAVEKVYQTSDDSTKPKPQSRITLLFSNDTNATFYHRRGNDLHRYHTTRDDKGRPTYFPWKSKNWAPSSVDNMIRQWHSIEAVFEMMTEYSSIHNIEYERVAMLRNDVVYLTPVDIMRIDEGKLDNKNENFVIPNFAKYPVNDRMIYGPNKAVEVWAMQRFKLLEDRVKANDKEDIGWMMHSESFMKASIVPAMESLGYKLNLNSDICFFRSRAKEVLMSSDCFRQGKVRGFIKKEKPDVRKIVEETVGRNCSKSIADKKNRNIQYMHC